MTTSHKGRYDITQWRNILESRGINARHINSLSSDSLQLNRKNEILSWYKYEHTPNEEFVIIDDDKLLNDLPGYIKQKLVLTSPSVGLTEELADNAIAILLSQPHYLSGQIVH